MWLLGAVQGTIAYAQGGDWLMWGFFLMRWAYFPTYLSFFVVGILAEQHDWLATMSARRQEQRKQRGCSDDLIAHTVVSIFSATSFIVLIIHQDKHELSVPTASFIWGFSSAMMSISFTNVVLAVFEKCLNVSNKVTQFLSRAAYATYLLHVNFILIFILAWKYSLSAMGEDVFAPDFEVSSGWWLVLGGVFLTFTCLPFTWVVSWYICRIPGIRNIL